MVLHSLVPRIDSVFSLLFGYVTPGFALTEAIALFALMIAFLILFVFRVKFVWKPSRLFSAR